MGAASSVSSKGVGPATRRNNGASNDNPAAETFLDVVPSGAGSSSAKSLRNTSRGSRDDRFNRVDGDHEKEAATSVCISSRITASPTASAKETHFKNLVKSNVNQFLASAIKSSAECQTRKKEESFMDSVFIKNWLSEEEATNLLQLLTEIGSDIRPENTAEAAKKRAKYPLWTKYYGVKRSKDGARALDRWGSYHESWVRVEEPPLQLKRCAELLQKRFHLTDEDVNSMVVNYYYDGSNTYIPAHRDTTACLADNSQIFCLSLGATRDFVLCSNEDAGKFDKTQMTVEREWKVGNGDLFAIGQETNQAYCHAVTQDANVQRMRISIIFRSVSKSFIDLDNAPSKQAVYSNGNRKVFAAECVTASGYGDAGTREHLSDLISDREATKKNIAAMKLKQQQEEQSCFASLSEYEKELRVSDASYLQSVLTSSSKIKPTATVAAVGRTGPKITSIHGVDETQSVSTEDSDCDGDTTAETDDTAAGALYSTVSSYYMGRGYAVPTSQQQ